MEFVDIVLGCSFGDEGKGKVVFDLLRNNYNLCLSGGMIEIMSLIFSHSNGQIRKLACSILSGAT